MITIHIPGSKCAPHGSSSEPKHHSRVSGQTGATPGRIYESRGGPEHLRWFWSFAVQGPMTRADRVATLDDAKAQFQKGWDAWKAWAKLEEEP